MRMARNKRCCAIACEQLGGMDSRLNAGDDYKILALGRKARQARPSKSSFSRYSTIFVGLDTENVPNGPPPKIEVDEVGLEPGVAAHGGRED